jgi:hypothetical protein
MKNLRHILILATAILSLSGCATSGSIDEPQLIQTILNKVLPPGFEGDLDAQHDGFYFGTSVHLTINLHGLKKDPSGKWTWTSGGYKRSGFFSTGHVTLTPSKQPTQ